MAVVSNPVGGAFGGRILSVIPCTCSAGLLLIVGPPVGGTFIYQPGASTLYKNYAPIPGHWALGTSIGKGVPCMVGIPPFCASAGSGALILKLGTS